MNADPREGSAWLKQDGRTVTISYEKRGCWPTLAEAQEVRRQAMQPEDAAMAMPDGPGLYDVTWSNGERETVEVSQLEDGTFVWNRCYPVGNGHLGKWRRA